MGLNSPKLPIRLPLSSNEMSPDTPLKVVLSCRCNGERVMLGLARNSCWRIIIYHGTSKFDSLNLRLNVPHHLPHELASGNWRFQTCSITLGFLDHSVEGQCEGHHCVMSQELVGESGGVWWWVVVCRGNSKSMVRLRVRRRVRVGRSERVVRAVRVGILLR